MTSVVGVDIGGSGLRLVSVVDGVAGPVRTAPGARITPAGIDLGTLLAATSAWVDRPPDVLVWSMRGLVGLADPAEVLRELRSAFAARRTVVTSDAVSSLVGALGAVRPGAVLAAGTGAVAFGTDFAGTWRRVDGWGHVLGDRGSGAAIGLEGLRAALRCHDGLTADGSALLAAAREHFGDPERWPRLVMTREDVPALLSGFAPAVTALADTDPLARRISHDAGTALAGSLVAAARGVADPVLSATGGVLRSHLVREAFEAALGRAGVRARAPAGGSLEGALILGQRCARSGRMPEHPAYLLVG